MRSYGPVPFFERAVPVPQQGVGAGAPGGAAAIPFIVGSNQYREAPFFTDTQQLDGNSHEFIHSITPGGFLRGVTLQFTSTGGVLGTTAALVGDSPWSILSSISLEDVSGGPILYPMSGFAYFVIQKYFQPWNGDPSKRAGFSNTINPAFTLTLMPEIRDTLCALANTDARAQYRIRFTLAAGVVSGQFGLTSVSTGVTQPTVTVKGYMETWASPDLHDLLGNPIQQVPDGLIASRFLMHEIPALAAGNNVIKFGLTGNELRCLGLVVRNGDSTKTRTDLTDGTGGPLDFRLDARRLWKMNQSQLVEEMGQAYPFLGAGTWTRETGVYIIPRFRNPFGIDIGEYWLQTVEQSLLQIEMGGSDLGNPPGSLEVIYDQLAVAGTLPPELEGL